MATQADGPVLSFTANEALTAYACVIPGGSRSVEYADSNDSPIGVTQRAAAEGEEVPVRSIAVDGTFKVTAAKAFADLANLYTADNGRVTDTDPGAGTIRFVALEAASGAGSVIEAIRKI